jgi:diguanylate cyclase (GGDEF)-like protein
LSPNLISELVKQPAGPALATLRAHQLAIDYMNQGIVLVDDAGRIGLANRQASQLLGLLPEKMNSGPAYREILEIQWNSGEFGPDGTAIDAQVRNMIRAAADEFDLFGGLGLYERTRPNGTVLEVRTTALPLGGIVRTYTDITERKRAEALIAHMAQHDSLTGLANRRHFLTGIEARFDDLKRHGDPFALLYIDLDRFKPINDLHGHAAGDTVLETIGRRLRESSGDHDVVARVGGDEFAVIKSGIGHHQATAFAQRITEALTKPIRIGTEPVRVGCSIGIALAPDDGSQPDALQTSADLALYAAKRDGRNAYRRFAPEMKDCGDTAAA